MNAQILAPYLSMPPSRLTGRERLQGVIRRQQQYKKVSGSSSTPEWAFIIIESYKGHDSHFCSPRTALQSLKLLMGWYDLHPGLEKAGEGSHQHMRKGAGPELMDVMDTLKICRLCTRRPS
eukprot:1627548-Amphidinium_carterae.5